MTKNLILVVEDDETIRKDICLSLRLNDYIVVEAENGSMALEIALNHTPDLVISDILMPEMDGYTLLKEMQSNEETRTIPFLFLTARTAREDVRNGMTLGADDFITKPFDIDELINSVDTRLRKKENIRTESEVKFEQLRSSISMSLPHEIRTPLNVIMGLSEFLLNNFDKTSQKDAKDMLRNICEDSKRLNRFFENYLFYANLEVISQTEGELEKLTNSVTHLADYVIKDVVMHHAGNTGRTFDVELELAEASIRMSYDNLSKLIFEICDNSFKFSERGSKVEINSIIENEFYSICFKDYGRGMEKEQIRDIGAYMQFGRRIYEQQGSGLGFEIVKRISELHKGILEIKSEPGSYTEVTVKLPIAAED